MAQGTVHNLVEALILNLFLIAIYGINLSGSDETHSSARTQVKHTQTIQHMVLGSLLITLLKLYGNPQRRVV